MRLKKESMRQVKDAAVATRQETDGTVVIRKPGAPPDRIPPPGMMWYRGMLVKIK